VTRYAIVEAPSVLGLFPRGVERLPEALLDAGIADQLEARRAGRVTSPAYDPAHDAATGLLNPAGLRDYALRLADVTGAVLDAGEFPVVLGGDCSILLGNLLALRRRGRHGLLFIDGHADFYQPDAEPNGEAASMDLALATGRGHGLSWDELETTIRVAAASGEALGMEVTIFNPTLDSGGAIARELVARLVRALEPAR
jgi:arginase